MNRTPPPHGWHQTDADRSLLAELVDRLPERIADAHAHIYRTAHMDPVPDFLQPPGPADSGVEEWRAHTGTIVGGAERLDGALILPYPNRSSDTAEVNRFVVEATRGQDGIRAALLATPECDPDGVDALAEPAIGGFKVYWCYATGPGDPQQAAPSQFLPEWVWQQAHERGWFITLHLMRDAALADPVNQREVREHCERYPDARLVLAHAGRGFLRAQHRRRHRLPGRPGERVVRYLGHLRAGGAGSDPARVRSAPAAVRHRLPDLPSARPGDQPWH